MTNSADTNRYMGLAWETLRAMVAKLRKNFVEVFIEIMFLYVSVRKVNFTQIAEGKVRPFVLPQIYRNYVAKFVMANQNE